LEISSNSGVVSLKVTLSVEEAVEISVRLFKSI